MKFETGHKYRSERARRARKEGLKGYEGYENFNEETTPELLEERKRQREELLKRQAERIEKLKQAEAEGRVFTKLKE
jgi:hypothetical protein